MKTGDLGGAFLRGTLWSVGLRWAMKGIGLVSTLVLARLLAPEDYGLVAMAMLWVSFIEIFFSVSSDAVLLRDAKADRALIDSAWTLRLLQSIAIAAIVALLSPVAAKFFHEPRLVPVILVLSIGIIVSGFGSYGPLLARKDLDFALEVRLAISAKMISFVFTVGLALWMRNYWALVYGTVFGYLIGCVMSYAFHSYRSRFTLCRVREIWNFSQWMLVSGVGQFFARKIDEFLVGRLGSPGTLGLYSVASDLGQTVSAELSGPLNRALLPVLAQIAESGARMTSAVSKAISASNILILAAGFGLAAVSDQAVAVLLGQKWTAASPMLAILSVAWAVRMLGSSYSTILLVQGNSRTFGLLTVAEAGILIVTGLMLLPHGVYGLVWARAITSVLTMILWMLAARHGGLTIRGFVRATWRPLLGAIVMLMVVRSIGGTLLDNAVVDFALRVLLGAMIYVTWIWVTWRLQGCPDGLEARATSYAEAGIRALKARLTVARR